MLFSHPKERIESMSTIRHTLPTATVALLLSLGLGTAAHAIAVPIANPGFETDALSPGGIKNTITDWDTSPGGGDGVYRPPTSDYPGGVPEGQNVAYANGPGNRVRQVLTGTSLQASTTYVLQVKVGWNNHDPFAGYIVQLRAGGVVLAQDNSSLTPAQGTFVTSTVKFTASETHPQLGTPLEIFLSAPGIQANFDDVRLSAFPPAIGACAESFVLPFYLADKVDPSGTNTLFAVRNLTGDPVSAAVEYFTLHGVSQRKDVVTLNPRQTTTVGIRNVPGLAVDVDGFARGFVKVVTAGDSNGTPVLGGDFFQVDVGNNSATGDKLARGSDLCTDVSIRFVDFGAGSRFTVYVTDPRGADPSVDPPSFTVQVYDEPGHPVGGLQPFWTADHALEFTSSDFSAIKFGSLKFDFTNSLGGTIYAEYSAQGLFSVGLASQCENRRPCDEVDCCPPGSPKATAAGLHYPQGQFPNCAAAIADALTTLDSFHYRNACQQAYGGPLPDAVLGAKILDCKVSPPLSQGNVVVAVEACCPLP
jgi:HpiC1 cyclase